MFQEALAERWCVCMSCVHVSVMYMSACKYSGLVHVRVVYARMSAVHECMCGVLVTVQGRVTRPLKGVCSHLCA